MTIPVIFRKWPESEGGDVIALFPTIPGTNDPYDCESYQHVGQHGSADPNGVIQDTKLAKPSEYADLMKELHSVGYKGLEVYTKYQYSFLDARRRALAGKPTTVNKKRKTTKSKSHRSSGGGGLGTMR
jgi:hypothetical protein